MNYPEINKRVLAFFDNDSYPFVGYWDGNDWLDNYGNHVYGEVTAWVDLSKLASHFNVNPMLMTKYEF